MANYDSNKCRTCIYEIGGYCVKPNTSIDRGKGEYPCYESDTDYLKMIEGIEQKEKK